MLSSFKYQNGKKIENSYTYKKGLLKEMSIKVGHFLEDESVI